MMPYLKVTIGNGESLGCIGICFQVPLLIGKACFNIDLLLLLIYGADTMIEVQWLAELSLILFDYK